jgi:hypothetical protein
MLYLDELYQGSAAEGCAGLEKNRIQASSIKSLVKGGRGTFQARPVVSGIQTSSEKRHTESMNWL